MVQVEDGYSFHELVDIAYREIKQATQGSYDLFNDFVDDQNYSEICNWCRFPDLQTPESIYERAINTAIYHLMVFYDVDCQLIQLFINEKIAASWNTHYITKKFESYSCNEDMCMFINDKQINIPKEFYDAIKRGDL